MFFYKSFIGICVVGGILFSALAKADCKFNAQMYAEGSRYGSFVCESGEWVDTKNCKLTINGNTQVYQEGSVYGSYVCENSEWVNKEPYECAGILADTNCETAAGSSTIDCELEEFGISVSVGSSTSVDDIQKVLSEKCAKIVACTKKYSCDDLSVNMKAPSQAKKRQGTPQ